MVRIPAEYQEVEYIESTGTQYIDTGTVLNNGCTITIDFSIEELTVNRVVYGWRRKGLYSNPYQFYIGANSQKVRYVAVGVSSYIVSPSSKYGHAFEYGIKNRIVIDSVNKRILVNDVVTDCNENFDNGNAFNEDGSSEYNPYLFAFNNSDSVGATCNDSKIYGYSVKYENELSQNFIPCYRKSDNEPGMYDTVSGTFFTNAGTGEFLVGNNVYYDTTNLLESRRRILLTTPRLESPIPANPLTFKSNMTTKLKEGKVYFTPVQEGEGDPSPDNVRPISGWDGITIEQANEYYRLIPEDVQAVTYNGLTMEYIGNGKYRVHGTLTSRYTTNPIYFEPFTCPDADGRMLRFFNSAAVGSILGVFNIKFYNGTELVEEWVFNEPNRVVQNYVSMAGKRIDNFKLFFGNALVGEQLDFTFQPSFTTSLKTITIPFPKTIYGGYVDLVNGEVVEECQAVVLDGDENLSKGTSAYDGVICTDRYINVMNCGIRLPSYSAGVSNKARNKQIAIWNRPDSYKWCFTLNSNTQLHVVFDNATVGISSEDDDTTRTSLINAWLTENPIDFYVPLATPIHHTIDPQVIRPLKGVNNIYSDANGNIEIKFWKH